MPQEREVEAEVVGDGAGPRKGTRRGRQRATAGPEQGLSPDDLYDVLTSIAESLEDITMEDGLGDAIIERLDALIDVLESFAESGQGRGMLTPAVEAFGRLLQAGQRARERRKQQRQQRQRGG